MIGGGGFHGSGQFSSMTTPRTIAMPFSSAYGHNAYAGLGTMPTGRTARAGKAARTGMVGSSVSQANIPAALYRSESQPANFDRNHTSLSEKGAATTPQRSVKPDGRVARPDSAMSEFSEDTLDGAMLTPLTPSRLSLIHI